MIYKRGEGWVYGEAYDTFILEDRTGRQVRMERRDPEHNEYFFFVETRYKGDEIRKRLQKHLDLYELTRCPYGMEFARYTKPYSHYVCWTGVYV